MRLRKGQTKVKLPPIGQIIDCAVQDSGHDPLFIVQQRRPENMPSNMPAGRPTHFALVHEYNGTELRIFPKPDQAYTLRLRYYPPALEL